jgi:TolB-like protein/cytochrome c-type biogenesis protein CcmH/NrfG
MGLVSELRRRNVFRMAVLYAVAAWLIMQVTEVVKDLANLPDWIGPTTLGLLALGFPIALIFSWFYELTPEGIIPEKDVDPEASITHVTGRRLDLLVISLLCAAVILFAYDKWWIGPPPEQSIAVLPFENMSADPEQEYFSDGLTETLLHMLAQVPELKVAARTSSFAFKGKQKDIREIALALGVAHVLEGSVQRATGRVRITAQLIRADDGFRVWSESYDRNLEDIFGIQDEIANRVSGALTRSLLGVGGGKQIVGVGTDDVDAYDLYLKAITEQAKGSYGSLQASEGLLKDALAKDPNFLDARTQLVSNYFQQVHTGLRPWESTIAEMIALLEQVLASRPDDMRAQAWMLVASVFRANLAGEEVDFPEATNNLRALVAEAASEIEPKLLLLHILTQMDEKEEALALMRDLLELDPLNPEIHRDVGYAYSGIENWDNASAALQRSLELEPDQPGAHAGLGAISRQTGDAVGMFNHAVKAMQMDPQDHWIPGGIAIDLYQLGLLEEGDQFRIRTLAIAPTSPIARVTELYRATCTGDNETGLALAHQMIADDMDFHPYIWMEALFILFDTAAKQGESAEALGYVESQLPGFVNFEQPAPLKVGIARYLALAAFYHTESRKELQQRLASLDYFLNELMFDGGGPAWRMQTLALHGKTNAAIDVALREFFTKPAIVYLDIDRTLSQLFLTDVAADPRIQAALERWREEKEQAAEEVRAYFGGLEAI